MVIHKSLKVLVILACATVLTLAVSSCKKKSEEAAPIEEPVATTEAPETTEPEIQPAETPETGRGPLEVVPLVGLGPLEFGMSKEQVYENFGQPERTEGQGVASYYLASKGISMMIHPRIGLQTIECWSKDYPGAPPELITFAGKTKEGIGMGATREQIVAAYGEPSKELPSGVLAGLLYDELKTTFMLVDNKLVNLRIQAPR
ncbi:MAG TPA: hypothetical protein VMW16_07075 [Sedimentisphaerales bacterium]|nr:hypothetical protein [Sedimentisphaerales bacterium]